MKILGNILKEAREKNNLDINEVSKKLNISENFLHAIEKGDYKKFPGEPYTFSFVKSYAKSLNLDIDFISKLYKEEFLGSQKSNFFTLPLSRKNEKFIFVKFGITSLILLSFLFIFYKFFLSQTYFNSNYALTPELDEDMLALVEEEELKNGINEIKKYDKKVSIIQKDTNNMEVIKKTTEKKSSAIAAINDEIIENNIILKFTGDTWIQIKDTNDKVILGKLMKNNETFIFEPNINYILTTGNAGNIKILINNKEIGKLGKKGEVLNSYNFINYLEKIKSN